MNAYVKEAYVTFYINTKNHGLLKKLDECYDKISGEYFPEDAPYPNWSYYFGSIVTSMHSAWDGNAFQVGVCFEHIELGLLQTCSLLR